MSHAQHPISHQRRRAPARARKISSAATGELSDGWKESGYWLTPALAVLMLPFFRKGWMAETAAQE
jgi:Ca-activated chloride channel homolog